jgi:cell division protein FtsW
VLGLVVALLVALGLIVLFSAGEVRALGLYGDRFYFIKRQVAFIGVGLLALVAVASFDYHNWRNRWGVTALLFGLVFLALLFVFCFRPINGSHRWILLGPIRFQPAEFAKLVSVLAVSVWLDRFALKIENFLEGAFYPVVIIAIMALPVFFQPDFGSVMVIGVAGFMLMFIAGTKLLHMAPFFLLGVGVFVWKVANTPNRMARLFAFTGISVEGAETAAANASHQSEMSIAAIKRGGLFGVGLLRSMQKQYYLPEAWTDFIFAVGAEEMGLVFSLSVILIFVVLFFLCLHIARHAADRFGQLLVLGMTFLIFFPAMFNIGVVCGVLPTKGMALPFFSYGGTHILASFVALGIIFSVGIHSLKDKKRAFLRKIVKN